MSFLRRLLTPSSQSHVVQKPANPDKQFKYTPLRESDAIDHGPTFRLLSLLPGLADSLVGCEIQNHSVHNTPPYEALSYCWGKVTQKADIGCNEGSLQITANLLEILAHLRYADKSRLLWIDQICIDQQNVQERSYQVSIMRLIYARAARTIVWLGAGVSSTKMAFDAISFLARVRAELQSSGVEYERLPDSDHILKRYDILRRSEKRRKVDSLNALLASSWFERVWVVQEVAVSNSVVVVQGECKARWEDFAAALFLIWELRLETFSPYHANNHRQTVLFIDAVRTMRKGGTESRLRRSLVLFRDLRATDPRDKVYALVGLSDASQVADPAMFSYDISVGDAYRLWTIYMLLAEKSLEVLSAVNRYRTSGDTMAYSWVPDWNVTDRDTAHHATAWPSVAFRATASSKMELKFQNKGTVMGLSGYLLDRVESVGTVMCHSPSATVFGSVFLASQHRYNQVWRSWETTAQVRHLEMYAATGERMWNAYWQTVLFGEHGFRPEEKEHVKAEFEDFLATHRRPFILGERLGLHRSRYLWAIYTMGTMILRGLGAFGKYIPGSGLKFTSRASQAGWRCMVRTSSGDIGLAVHSVRVGDYIALFKGARLPFVVRSNAEGWRLVGDCYVHGVMHGEAWQEDMCAPFWIH